MMEIEQKQFVFSNEEKKLTFIISPKAMSSTGLAIFFDFIGLEYNKDKHTHSTRMFDYKNYTSHQKDYTVVQVTRNPFTRIVSCYLFMIKQGISDLSRRVYSQKWGFKFFLNQILSKGPNNLDQHTYIQYKNIIPDFLIRVESVKEDIEYIKNNSNLDFKLVEDRFSPKNMKGNDDIIDPKFLGGDYNEELFDIITNKKNVNKIYKNYNQFYDEENKNIVEELYKDDIFYFKYQYPFDEIYANGEKVNYQN